MGKQIITYIILFAFGIGQLIAQQPPVIKKSTQKRIIDGREYFIHKVEHGNTLYSIAKVYEVSVSELILENQGADKGLVIGRELKIPVKSRDAIVKQSYGGSNFDFFYHIVKNGDDFKKIATLYVVSVDKLKLTNSAITEPLKVGQYIKIPFDLEPDSTKVDDTITGPNPKAVPEKKDEPDFINYRAVSGDNLFRIAIRFNVTIEEIKQLNPGLTEQFAVGRTIKIPNKKNKSTYINHRVQRREKLTQIAKNYAVNIGEIQQLNPYVRNRPQTGQIIKIPTGYVEEILKSPAETQISEETVEPIAINRDSLKCFSGRQNELYTYRVALLIPLYLEQADSLQFNPEHPQMEIGNEDPFQFISFYYGVLMAVDSLKKQGLKIDLYVYDVDDHTEKAINVLNRSELKQMDLIIGPFFSSIFPFASGFAKKYNIPIVNPLTRRPEILQNNSNVFKFQPTESSQLKDVCLLVKEYFSDSKIFLLDQQADIMKNRLAEYPGPLRDVINNEYGVSNIDIHNLILEKAAADTSLHEGEIQPLIKIEGKTLFTEEIEMKLEDSSWFQNSIIPIHYKADSLSIFEKNASVFRNNLVIIDSDDNVFVLDILTKLNILRDTFPVTVIGLPEWENFDIDKMDIEIYKSLNTHYFSSAFVDYADWDIKNFLMSYRRIFLSEPENYAFIGFDIGWYFFNALMKFGKDFEDCLTYYHPKLIHAGMDFRKNGRGSGYENIHWEILKFRDYHLQKVELPKEPLSIDY